MNDVTQHLQTTGSVCLIAPAALYSTATAGAIMYEAGMAQLAYAGAHRAVLWRLHDAQVAGFYGIGALLHG